MKGVDRRSRSYERVDMRDADMRGHKYSTLMTR